MPLVKVGPGPLTSATGFSVTSRLDRAGEFSFSMPGSDPLTEYITTKRNISIYAYVNGVDTYVGGGIIDNISKKPNSDGYVNISVSGNDQLRLLTNRTVAGDFAGVAAETLVYALEAYVPDWLFAPDPEWVSGGPNMYLSFSGETVLGALTKFASKLGAHFYVADRRAIQLLTTPVPSGVRAIQATGDLVTETCAITDLEVVYDSYELATRIIPFGAGQGNARLTLAATSYTGDAGYTLNLAGNYLKHNATEAAYGIIERRVEFKDIVPLSNTDADMEAAANALYESAKIWLDLNRIPQKAYRLKIAGCSQILHPMQTIRVVYKNDNLDINDDLIILETTVQGGPDGIATTDLVVSNLTLWPATDSGSVVEAIKQSHAFIAHPQLNANSYTTGYTRPVDATYNATFRFRFGSEVTQLNQVLFEFQLLSLESTVKSVGATSTTTSSGGGATPTSTSGGSSTPTSSSGGGTTETSTSYSPVENHSHQVEVVDSTPSGNLVYYSTSFGLNSLGAGSGDDGPTTLTTLPLTHDHDITIPDHTHSVSISGHTHDVTVPAHTHTVTPTITAVYGIFRETSPNTFNLADLEYSVNSGTWFSLDTATVVDTGWYQLDLTALLYNATTFRPLQISNHLDIRKKAAAASLTGMIDGLLSVRSVIQSIAYT